MFLTEFIIHLCGNGPPFKCSNRRGDIIIGTARLVRILWVTCDDLWPGKVERNKVLIVTNDLEEVKFEIKHKLQKIREKEK